MLTAKVTLDTTGLDQVREKLKALNGLKIDVGVLGADGAKRYVDPETRQPGLNVATVATINEYGKGGVPARPAMRRMAFDVGEVAAKVGAGVRAALGKTGPRALSAAGQGLAELMRRQYVTSRSWAIKNAPYTISLKGFDYPLYETGLLSDSISYRIKDRNGRQVSAGRVDGTQ